MNIKTIQWSDGSISYYQTYYENNEVVTKKLFTSTPNKNN